MRILFSGEPKWNLLQRGKRFFDHFDMSFRRIRHNSTFDLVSFQCFQHRHNPFHQLQRITLNHLNVNPLFLLVKLPLTESLIKQMGILSLPSLKKAHRLAMRLHTELIKAPLQGVPLPASQLHVRFIMKGLCIDKDPIKIKKI
jgi:hypothetical protein